LPDDSSRNAATNDTFELPVPAAVDHRIAAMKHLYIFFDH
jgi:hypothetical protein